MIQFILVMAVYDSMFMGGVRPRVVHVGSFDSYASCAAEYRRQSSLIGERVRDGMCIEVTVQRPKARTKP